MTNNEIEVYEFYKEEYPGQMLLFHVGDKLVAFKGDAELLSTTTIADMLCSDKAEVCYDPCSVMKELGNCGECIKIIEYKNDEGRYELPDINRIKKERSRDY